MKEEMNTMKTTIENNVTEMVKTAMTENINLICTETNEIKGMFQTMMTKMSTMDASREATPVKGLSRSQHLSAVSLNLQEATTRFGAAHQ
eukprot:9479593-Ditylum_brightwellii.AAC.2